MRPLRWLWRGIRRLAHIDPAWLKGCAQLLGAVAAVLAMSIVFVGMVGLRDQLDKQNEVSACRSRLTAEVTLATAANQVAFSTLLSALASGLDTAEFIKRIGDTGGYLTTAAEARQSFEDDPNQRCPIKEVPHG